MKLEQETEFDRIAYKISLTLISPYLVSAVMLAWTGYMWKSNGRFVNYSYSISTLLVPSLVVACTLLLFRREQDNSSEFKCGRTFSTALFLQVASLIVTTLGLTFFSYPTLDKHKYNDVIVARTEFCLAALSWYAMLMLVPVCISINRELNGKVVTPNTPTP